MYNENSFKNYIFWLKVRRIVLMLLFSVIGCLIGTLISEYLVNVLLVDYSIKVLVITTSTLIFFGFAVLLTINTAKEVQDGYWKIAFLRKLTVMSKKLDNIPSVDEEESEEEL